MKVVKKISISQLSDMAEKMYSNLVKADVDISKKLIIIDMEMHADGEAYLLDNGSEQANLWGINLHPDKYDTAEFIEFDSMINIRPRQNNPSRDVLDKDIQDQIRIIIEEAIHE